MTIDLLKNSLPDFAKDMRLNLSTILTQEGSPDLTEKQIVSVLLAAAFATRNQSMIQAALLKAETSLTEEEVNALKAAATIMAMNNIYYRFTHVMEDQTYSAMPAKLRMNVMVNPGIDKVIFELSSMAISAINGCGKCMNAHASQLERAGVSKQAIQSAVRIASVANAVAMAKEIAD